MKSISQVIINSMLLLILFCSCGSKSNNRGIDAADLDKVLEEERTNNSAEPERSVLTADELIELSACKDAPCVQLYMKDKASHFFYPKKGEYTSLNRGMVLDSTSKELLMPFSTVYFASEPGASWRIAHSVHKKELSDALLNEFIQKGFVLVDSFRYYATEAKCFQYTSPQYPRMLLLFSPTYKPWYFKGLYMNPKWLSYVFEFHRE